MKTKQVILFGPPGVGVKAQASILAEQWHLPHISMGKLLQEAIAQQTTIGMDVRPFVESEELVPDALVIKLLRKRFEQPDAVLKGWVLDGFPRTLAQANALDEWCLTMGQSAPIVVHLKAMTGLLINRLWSENGQSEPIVAIRRRLERYEEETSPLLAYYQQQGLLKTVNGSLSFAEVTRELSQLGYEETGTTQWLHDEADLDLHLEQESRLVVDCMASWCGSCKQVTPLIDQLADVYHEQVTIRKIDFDANRQISKRFGLKGIPAVMFFKDGELVETLTGVKSYQEYSAAITGLL
jgi:thioredoxin